MPDVYSYSRTAGTYNFGLEAIKLIRETEDKIKKDLEGKLKDKLEGVIKGFGIKKIHSIEVVVKTASENQTRGFGWSVNVKALSEGVDEESMYSVTGGEDLQKHINTQLDLGVGGAFYVKRVGLGRTQLWAIEATALMSNS
jgi:recombination DNA repair RAD52 pathway protein